MFSTVNHSKEKYMLLILATTKLSVMIAVANFNFLLLPNYKCHNVLVLIIKLNLKAYT